MAEKESEECASPGDGDKEAATPLFLFLSCKTSGSSFMRHKILDIAVHCWPYNDNAPVFYRRINHNDTARAPRRPRSKKDSRPAESNNEGTPMAVFVLEELLQWIDNTTQKASSTLGSQLYPVLIAHQGETFQFLFLFRMLEYYSISAAETLEAHNVHFADPVPILKQYKEAKHSWLVESRSLGLGSLLNDWFPAQFDEADLMYSRSRGALVMKLYTQSPLLWLLYRVPIYNTQEWMDFYEGEKLYQEDKWELQENIPNGITGIQRKMTIRKLLRYGYNWSSLIDLYKCCGSPQHFRQELRDLDVKTAAAGQITMALGAMKLEQDGSREYKVRIRSNMPFAKYYHLTDARGRHFILRVANVLPPCIFSVSNLLDNQWRVPESLLRMGPQEAWDAMIGSSRTDSDAGQQGASGDEPQGCTEGVHHGDETGLDVITRQLSIQSEESESDSEWNTPSVQGNPVASDGELPECFFKEPAPVHVPTSFVKGVQGTNFFRSPSLEWLAVDIPAEATGQAKSSNLDSLESPAMDSASSCGSSPEGTSASTNQEMAARSDHSTSANHQSRDPTGTGKCTWINQRDSTLQQHSTSTNQGSCISTSGRNSGRLPTRQRGPGKSHHLNSTNRRKQTKPRDSTSTNDTLTARSHHPSPANQTRSSKSIPESLTCTFQHSKAPEFHCQDGGPKEKGHIPPRFQSKQRNHGKKTRRDS